MKKPNQSSTPQNSDAAEHTAPDQTIRLNFRNAPLWRVLDYLGEAAGFTVEVKSNVTVSDTVDAWSDQPLSHEEALRLLEQVLRRQGCTLIQNGQSLVVMRTEDAKKSYIPIRLARNYQGILKGPVSSRNLFASAAPIWSN